MHNVTDTVTDGVLLSNVDNDKGLLPVAFWLNVRDQRKSLN